MRFYTVPTAKEARRSVVWAIWLIGIFYLFTLVLGYGAGGARRARDHPGGTGRRQLRGPAAGLRARRHAPARHHLGGRVRDDPRGRRRPDDHRRGVVRARHLRVSVIKHGEVDARRRGAGRPDHGGRRSASLAIVGGIFANGQNVAFLVALAFAVAASREPADDPLLAVLEAVQHRGRAVEHVRRARSPASCSSCSRRWCPARSTR